jgi:DNA-binding transcriptional LysR family regulator
MRRFKDLEAFIAVVEAGSFTAAAERLVIAKSAVSRRVSSLEERLGVQLLRRTTRRLNLTETGQSFYEHSARILADLDEAEAAVAQQHGELRGNLRVALPLSFGARHMYEPIAEFSRLHPRVTFDLDLNDRRIDLIAEGVDVAVRIGRLATTDDLLQHDCLVYSNLPDPTKWVCTDREGVRHSVDVPVTMTASSGDFLCASASEGLGLVLQPTFIAGQLISRGELQPVLTDYQWPVTPAYAIYPPTRHLSYRVREFIDFLAERFAGTPYWDRDCC